jgi:type I restriction enzyme S subunit
MIEKMKPSGIAWIGDIPVGWDIKKIKYVIQNDADGIKVGPFGSALTNEVVSGEEGQYKIYGQANLIRKDFNYGDNFVAEENYRRLINYEVLPDDIAVSMMGTIGKCAVVPHGIQPGIMDSHLIKIRLSKKMNPRFFEYIYESCVVYEQLVVNSKGSIMNGLNSTIVKSVFLAVPSFSEQTAISDFLDAQCAKIDSVIADIEKQIETLQKYKKSLITEMVTNGLDRSVPMKDSGIEWIGKIPAGWKTSRVKYLIDGKHPYPIGDGDHGMIKADDYLDEGIPYIRVLNLTWGDGLNLDNLVFISDKMNAMIKNSELRPNDILIAKTGATIGKTAIVPESLPISNTTSHVGKITLPDTHCAKYFFYVMTSNIVQKQIQDISAMQSTRPELGIEGMRDLVVVVPPLNTQQRIADYLDDRCTKTDAILKTKIAQLEVVKKHKASIIYEYVTGKKRVTEVN